MNQAPFIACARPCHDAGRHTRVWGDCAAARDTDPPADTTALTERIEAVLRRVPIILGPEAKAMLDRGESVKLLAADYTAMARAVVTELADGAS